MRVCPFPQCGVEIPAYKFCCPAHWNRLSELSKKRIYAAWDAYRKGSIGVEELRLQQQKVIDGNRNLFDA